MKQPPPDRGLLLRAAAAAKEAGCPAAQVRNFLSAGYIPQPHQWQFHAAARAADAEDGPTMIAMGGDRGGAKSHAIMAQVTLDDMVRWPGVYALYLRKVGKAARKALEQLRAKTFLDLPHNFNRAEGIVSYPNGSTAVIGHFRTDEDVQNYVGIEYPILVLEEATQLREATFSLIRGSNRSNLPHVRPRLYGAANPGGAGHQHFRRTFVIPHRSGGETATRFIPASWRQNAFVSQAYRDYLDSLTGVLREIWREGNWDVSAGSYFLNWNPDVHVVTPFPITPDMPAWASFDYGFSHPTAVYFHVLYEGVIYTVAEHVHARRLPAWHAERLHQLCHEVLNRQIGDLLSFPAGHDVFAQRGDEEGRSIAEQYAGHGIVFDRANIARKAGAAEMTMRLGSTHDGVRPSWFVFRSCEKLIECIPNMQVNPRDPEDVLKVDADLAGENGDDPYDSARYGLMERPLNIALPNSFVATY